MIVVICPQFYGVHGIARYVQSFLKNAKPEHRDDLLLFCEDGDLTDLVLERIKIVRIVMPNGRLGLIRWAISVRRHIRALGDQIDCLNIHVPPLLPALILTGLRPTVLTAHTTYHGMSGEFYGGRQFKSQWNFVSVWLKKVIERKIFSRATKIITLTEQGRQELLHYGVNKPTHVIPNGVAINDFQGSDTVPKDVDIVFAGRVERRKGSRALVEVCLLLIKLRPGIKIIIVGEGDDFTHLSARLKEYGENVLLTGRVPFNKVLQYYQRSRLGGSTSYYEGLPGACLEAMAVGLPVVVWDYLFYDNLVKDGINGRRIKPNDFAGFSYAVCALLDNPKELDLMSESARKIVLQDYSWRNLAGSVFDCLSLRTDVAA